MARSNRPVRQSERIRALAALYRGLGRIPRRMGSGARSSRWGKSFPQGTADFRTDDKKSLILFKVCYS